MDKAEGAVTDALRRLHEAYIFKVNQAVEREWWDVVRELADTFSDDAQREIVSASRR